MKKKIFGFILAFVFIFSGTICLSACKNEEKLAYVSLDINPAIELIVDGNNKVVSVRGENQDGLVLLYNESGIVGEKVDKAVEKIIELAKNYGYIDQNNNVVDTLVTAENNRFANKILKKVNTTITATSETIGFSVKTSGEGAYSLVRKFEEFKNEFPNNSAIQNMSISKFKLAVSVSETGEVSLEAAVEMDDKELVEMLKNATAQIEAYATEEFLKAKAEAVSAFEKAVDIPALVAYSEFYASNFLSHATTAYYGGAYQMYKSASIGFNAVCDVLEYGAKIQNYPLDETQIQNVLTALGMQASDIDKIKDQDGNVTVSSIEAYVDKLFKNSPASEQLEQTKESLSTALKNIESNLKLQAQDFVASHKTEIESAKTIASNAIDVFNNVFQNLPESVKTALDTITGGIVSDLNSIVTTVETLLAQEKIEIEDLREVATKCDKKANEYLEKIKADLSAEELEWIETRKDAIKNSYQSAKASFEEAINNATTLAKQELENIKNSLRNQQQ